MRQPQATGGYALRGESASQVELRPVPMHRGEVVLSIDHAQ